jgi:hypothetical protein
MSSIKLFRIEYHEQRTTQQQRDEEETGHDAKRKKVGKESKERTARVYWLIQ